MKATSRIYDNRIKAWDVLFDFTIGEYLDAVRNVVEQNEFQRKRVTSGGRFTNFYGSDASCACQAGFGVVAPAIFSLIYRTFY